MLQVGFHKPHLPFVVPRQFFKMYDRAATRTAPNPHPPSGMPSIALQNYELPTFGDIQTVGWSGTYPYTSLAHEKAKDLVHAYQAAVSYADFNVGKVIGALRGFPTIWNQTIVRAAGPHTHAAPRSPRASGRHTHGAQTTLRASEPHAVHTRAAQTAVHSVRAQCAAADIAA